MHRQRSDYVKGAVVLEAYKSHFSWLVAVGMQGQHLISLHLFLHAAHSRNAHKVVSTIMYRLMGQCAQQGTLLTCKRNPTLLQPLTALSSNVQTDRGHEQARAGAEQIKQILQSENETFKLFFYMSPYKRSKQTYEGIAAQFSRSIVAGTQEEVQLREQDFGNFQVSCCLPTAKYIICLNNDHINIIFLCSSLPL